MKLFFGQVHYDHLLVPGQEENFTISSGVEIPCPTCPTREISMTDKWNFPAELSADK